jgi:hypothetical protein
LLPVSDMGKLMLEIIPKYRMWKGLLIMWSFQQMWRIGKGSDFSINCMGMPLVSLVELKNIKSCINYGEKSWVQGMLLNCVLGSM